MFKVIVIVAALGAIRAVVNEIGDYASEVNPYKPEEREDE